MALEAMPERSNQKSVTLSDKAIADYELIARWKKQPLATVLARVIEADHESPAFGAKLRRAKEELSSQGNEQSE